MEPTIELTVTAEGESADEIVALLSAAGFEGFWEDGTSLRAYIPLPRWNDAVLASARQAIAEHARATGQQEPLIDIRTIPPQNWNARWEESIQPLRIPPGIVIAPSWRHVEPAPDELLLTIDPKMSFGTGHHETTRLMLSLLHPRVSAGCTMLDVGTGTGVLAIAAARLGARRVVGVDIDEWSQENARENATVNGVDHVVTILLGDLSVVPPESFDIVAANIQRSVIEPLLPDLAARTHPTGSVLVAGLLSSESHDMRSAFRRHSLIVEEERSENEWIAFALRHA